MTRYAAFAVLTIALAVPSHAAAQTQVPAPAQPAQIPAPVVPIRQDAQETRDELHQVLRQLPPEIGEILRRVPPGAPRDRP
jgi:hypothetical protein